MCIGTAQLSICDQGEYARGEYFWGAASNLGEANTLSD